MVHHTRSENEVTECFSVRIPTVKLFVCTAMIPASIRGTFIVWFVPYPNFPSKYKNVQFLQPDTEVRYLCSIISICPSTILLPPKARSTSTDTSVSASFMYIPRFNCSKKSVTNYEHFHVHNKHLGSRSQKITRGNLELIQDNHTKVKIRAVYFSLVIQLPDDRRSMCRFMIYSKRECRPRRACRPAFYSNLAEINENYGSQVKRPKTYRIVVASNRFLNLEIPIGPEVSNLQPVERLPTVFTSCRLLEYFLEYCLPLEKLVLSEEKRLTSSSST